LPACRSRAWGGQRKWQFDYHRLDVWWVAYEAFLRGSAIAKALPQGYGKLKDHLQRALAGAFTQTSEVAARTGADRAQRVRAARSEVGESAAALEAVGGLGLADPAEVDAVIELLWRQSAMLYRLAQPRR
jgi:hypothetical protein